MEDFFDYITEDFFDDVNNIISKIFPEDIILNKALNVIISIAWVLISLILLIFFFSGENSILYPNSPHLESENFWEYCLLGAGLGVFLDVFCIWGIISILTIPALFWFSYETIASKIALIPTGGLGLCIIVVYIKYIIENAPTFWEILGIGIMVLIFLTILVILSVPALISDSFVSEMGEFTIIPMFVSTLVLSLVAGILAFIIAAAIYHIQALIIIALIIISVAAAGNRVIRVIIIEDE